MRLPLALMLIAALALPALAPSAYADESERPPLSVEDQADLLVDMMKSKDSEVRLKAAKDALENTTPVLTSPLIKLLKDDAALVRYAAVEALGARTDKDGKKKAASALAARIDKLEKAKGGHDELMLSLAALRDLAQKGPMKGLMKGIKNDSNLDVAEGRLYAVAAVPSKDAVELLIQFLAKGSRRDRPGQKGAAAKALRWATGAPERGLGADPDRWRQWWKDNEKDFDFEAIQAARAEAAAQRAAKAEKDAERKKKRAERKKQGKNKNKNKNKNAPPKSNDDGSDA